jgi:hypothetical protein
MLGSKFMSSLPVYYNQSSGLVSPALVGYTSLASIQLGSSVHGVLYAPSRLSMRNNCLHQVPVETQDTNPPSHMQNGERSYG